MFGTQDMLKRRKTKVIKVGSVKIGGNSPISIQSMLKSKTSCVEKAVRTINGLKKAGCEIIRVAVKDASDARAIKVIKKEINIPLVADIHFDYQLALESIRNDADKIRINPGNISKPEHLKEIIKAAKKRKIPIRIGINSGSIPWKIQNPKSKIQNKSQIIPHIRSGKANPKFVQFVLKFIKFFEKENFRDIIISLKSSDVYETVDSYRKLARVCDYPFHLGITAAGPYDSGIVKSSIGIGTLLLDGIGDTIRVSLTGDACEEVIAAKRILQSLKLRNFGPDIISCPTCGRCQVDLKRIVEEVQSRQQARGNRQQGKRSVKIAVMGCEVNGPGEARDADIGIAFGKNSGMLFKKGKIVKKVRAKDAVKELLNILGASS